MELVDQTQPTPLPGLPPQRHWLPEAAYEVEGRQSLAEVRSRHSVGAKRRRSLDDAGQEAPQASLALPTPT